jgi:EmrB/QacA subfamily drug resistance transporter
LLVISTVQLLMVLDVTIVNIALPTIQRDLSLSVTAVSWTVTAYVLAFGGLLLLGGRLADRYGGRRMLLVGVALFTLGSLAAGAANSTALLLAARTVQGAGAAGASPAALALIPATFPEPAHRARAMAVYTAMSGVGAATGLLVGGSLTEWTSWRMVFIMPVPFGAALMTFAPRVLPETGRDSRRLPLSSAALATTSGAAIVYALSQVASDGWQSRTVTLGLVAGVAGVIALAAWESGSSNPLLPHDLLRDGSRLVALAGVLVLGATMLGILVLMSQFLQQGLGLSALRAGAGFLPFTAARVATSQVSARLLPRVSAWSLIAVGASVATLGTVALSTIDPGDRYAVPVLVPLILAGTGFGGMFVPAVFTALQGVSPTRTGSMSGVISTVQQLGAAVGVAVLVSVSSGGHGRRGWGQPLHPGTGLAAAAVALGCLAVLALVVALHGRRKHRPAEW